MRSFFRSALRAVRLAYSGSSFILVCTAVALATAAACATSDDETKVQPSNDSGPSPEADTGAAEGEPTDAGVTPVVTSCSAEGWCITSLPDDDLTLKDIWPFESRAFAIAESQTLGVKVLEWNDAEGQWSYIDDNTQNDYEGDLGKYAGSIWAPNENEVYYGSAPAFIYHGKRSDPASPWSWQRSRLPDNSRDSPERDHGLARYLRSYQTLGWQKSAIDYTALGVWGTSADDVYAWYANTIFHWESDDGGAPGWVPEHIEDDTEALADTFFIFGASGSSHDDIWFAGGRARYDDTGKFPWPTACPTVIHKTPQGYRRIVDYVIDDANSVTHIQAVCSPKAGVLSFTGEIVIAGWGSFATFWANGSWVTNIASAGPGSAVGIVGGTQFVYVTSEDGGLARYNSVNVNITGDLSWTPSFVNAVWVQGTDAWIGGWGLVLRADKDLEKWSLGEGLSTPSDNAMNKLDAATYSVSTTAIDGAPLDVPIYQVRGTSNVNLWAIGPRYALHKTTQSTP